MWKYYIYKSKTNKEKQLNGHLAESKRVIAKLGAR